MDLRHEGDYQDFAEISEDEAKGAVETANTIFATLKETLEKIFNILTAS